jgi:glycogen phosphorylase
MIHKELFGYEPQAPYQKPVAYFSMEYAIDQSLKLYSGGLGFLAGSHMRSVFELKQNVIGIGLLWKYGYYDQTRDVNGYMEASNVEKKYNFLMPLPHLFVVNIHAKEVFVKAFLVHPNTFQTAPLILLSTDIPENDYLSQTITHRLYDANESTRVAQSIILGAGGVKILDILGLTPEIYHLNEAHALTACFYLYNKLKSWDSVKERVIFTTHTPETAGNELRSAQLLEEMQFFYGVNPNEIYNHIPLQDGKLNYALAALKIAKKANGVSQLHGKVSREMWKNTPQICPIDAITNAQNKKYWADKILDRAFASNDNQAIIARKKEMKAKLFKIVADQTGKLLDVNILTLVWARRFAGYKRADLLLKDFDKFLKLVNNKEKPIQIIWAGKPYPADEFSVNLFREIQHKTLHLPNCAVLTGYELELSAKLKEGSDVWLNNPILPKEASGTSGMTAAMNGSINFSIPDGWMPEFGKHLHNCFEINAADMSFSQQDKDNIEHKNLMDVLENDIIPMYYLNQEKWLEIMKNAAKEIVPYFDSNRMADEYYSKMYNS